MLVHVSGSTFSFPAQCACCGVPPNTTYIAAASRTTGKRVIRTATKTWRFPYCSDCLAHLRVWPRPWGCGMFLLGVITAGLAWLIVAFLDAEARKRARAMCCATCASPSAAVAYEGWAGSVHSFDFRSLRFATAFMRSNRRKLINMDYEALRLLDEPDAQPAATEIAHDGGYRDAAPAPARVEAPRVAVPSGDDDERTFLNTISALEGAKGPASRRAVLARALDAIQQQHVRERLYVEAARIEVRAVLDKVDGLKTAAAKRRNLEEALANLRSDPVPDDLQGREIALLEEALRDL